MTGRAVDVDEILKNIEEIQKSPWFENKERYGEYLARKEAVEIVRDLCVKAAKTVGARGSAEWKFDNVHGVWICSRCGKPVPSVTVESVYDNNDEFPIEPTGFCPTCGAYMKNSAEYFKTWG